MTLATRISVADRAEWNDSLSGHLGVVIPPTVADAPLHAQLRAHEVGDIRLIEVTSSQLSAVPHTPPGARAGGYWLCTQVEGAARMRRAGTTVEIGTGDAVFHTADSATDFTATADFRGIALVAPRWAVPMSPRRLAAQPVVRLAAGSGLADVFGSLLASLAAAMPTISSSEAVRVLWAALDIGIATFSGEYEPGHVEPDDARRARLAQVKAYVLANLADPDLTVARVAAANYMSPRTVQALFAGEGESVAAWVRARRIERACRELTDPVHAHLAVSAIAARLGYRSPSHFGQVFYATLGTTPHAYRSAVAGRAARGS